MSAGDTAFPGSAAADAEELVAGLTLEEQVALLAGRDMWNVGGIAEVPRIWVADGPHGLRKQLGDPAEIGLAESVPATCFPPAATLACSWDPALAEEIGRAIGAEAKANGVSVVLGPGLNLKRHPCCGRNFEYFSEDPLLSGKMAAGLVRGLQSAGVGACVKHFAANNQEAARMTVDAIVDARTLRELYLTGFEIAVREGEPWAVMCAYNRVNGVYCSDSGWLLTRVLRDEWGFGGLVMSDWGAVNDRVAGVRAGLDLEMPGPGANAGVVLQAAVSGALDKADVRRAATRVATLAFAGAAEIDPSAPYDAEAHHELARRAAAASTVLLVNNGVLPLRWPSSIAVVGALAERPRYQGAGSSEIAPTRLDTPLDAIRERAETAAVTYAAVYDPVCGAELSGGVADAVAAAATADVALVFVGLPPVYESEGFDRDTMRMPACHDRLVQEVAAVNSRTVVVLMAGSPVEMSWAHKPAAILLPYLGGQAGGSAVADVLFGDAEPGGRLAETWPVELADVPADENFPGAPRQVEYREGLNVGYRYFTTAHVPVRFCFGHGLSYTTFRGGTPVLSAERIAPGQGLSVTVPVTNSGARAGSAVTQVYVRRVEGGVPGPDRVLGGFARFRLEPGETREAVVEIGPRAFQYWDAAGGAWRTPGGVYELRLGGSVDDVRVRATVVVAGDGVDAEAPVHPDRVAGEVAFAAMLGHPIPEAEGPLPYRRNTTIADLAQTWRGRLLRKGIMAMVRKQMAGIAGGDPTRAAMVERVIEDMPLRQLVMASGGRLSYRRLDTILRVLNAGRR
ncbi:glycoside hydrolase family 3 C-terminal domain-containing protein [Anaerosoma tenue]|uniref:glycoside hydrolase family 3 C-terminal domain-containing protein n=1 Tax=Anaerosoma tenue TaxID=2933588 RepID=UPI002260F43B|nr:glycoside hydrolase family 3 C-terminal domain-containing protein [Anaerosoma tenue]MCK8114817.1 glycoside hydrolase family 3 C-terminal domain-containing protein [Anaerosoma tenue]